MSSPPAGIEAPPGAVLPRDAPPPGSVLPTEAPRTPPSSSPPATDLPRWLTRPKDKLPQFLKYVWKVYGLPRRLMSLRDGRQRPVIPTSTVVEALLFTAILRLPSLNALEGELKQSGFQKLLGCPVRPGKKALSADTGARSLDTLDHDQLHDMRRAVIAQAERNKVFREGGRGARRAVAIDGWEPFRSYKRHCEHCLVRTLTVNGGESKQYYHAFVVALLLGSDCEVVLDLEPLRTADLRKENGDESTGRHEGEQTAARRLIRRLHATWGRFLDLFVLDALFANGPMMTDIVAFGYGGVITLKKETDEPFKEALVLLEGKPPVSIWDDTDRREHMEAGDVDGIETLDTFPGKVRVLRVQTTSCRTGEVHIWSAAVMGENLRKLPVRILHDFHRDRWHVENTAFNQWTQYWHLDHVFRHTPGAVVAVMLLWILAFDLLQLFVYKCLRRPRVPKDPCDTIRALVARMYGDLRDLPGPVPWLRLLDSS